VDTGSEFGTASRSASAPYTDGNITLLAPAPAPDDGPAVEGDAADVSESFCWGLFGSFLFEFRFFDSLFFFESVPLAAFLSLVTVAFEADSGPLEEAGAAAAEDEASALAICYAGTSDERATFMFCESTKKMIY
jgi:hypothetical protein